MVKKHVWRIKKEYFQQLKSGKKSLEIRVGYSQVKKVQKGDIITFENYGRNEFDVLQVKTYSSFDELLDKEGVDKILPGMTHSSALNALQNIYPKNKEREALMEASGGMTAGRRGETVRRAARVTGRFTF